MVPDDKLEKERRVFVKNIEGEKSKQAQKGYSFVREEKDPRGRENYRLLKFKKGK